MSEDPVVQEVRRIRNEHAAQFDYDLKAIFADLKRSEEARDPQQSPLLSPQDNEGDAAHDPVRTQTRFARLSR